MFRSSSVVEQSTVNRSVVGSNPTCGAIKKDPYYSWASVIISFRQELYITERIKKISPKTGREITVTNATDKVQKEGFELVSDIIDAMSAGRFQDNFSAWGHGVDYYKKSGMIYKETYANLFALQNNKEALAYLDKYFPNVSTVFKKRMLELAKDNW